MATRFAGLSTTKVYVSVPLPLAASTAARPAISDPPVIVTLLKQEDFKIFSDGVEQKISFFQLEKRQGELRPLAIVFALDVSGSMTSDEILRLREALKSFSNHLADHPVVYAVMTFGMRVKTLQKFTAEPNKLDEALERIARDAPSGLSTHTYDAVDV